MTVVVWIWNPSTIYILSLFIYNIKISIERFFLVSNNFFPVNLFLYMCKIVKELQCWKKTNWNPCFTSLISNSCNSICLCWLYWDDDDDEVGKRSSQYPYLLLFSETEPKPLSETRSSSSSLPLKQTFFSNKSRIFFSFLSYH